MAWLFRERFSWFGLVALSVLAAMLREGHYLTFAVGAVICAGLEVAMRHFLHVERL